MKGQAHQRSRRFSGSRHSVQARDDFYRPLPVKSEAVGVVASFDVPQLGLSADLSTEGEEPTIIDESQSLLSAGELYAAALAGVDAGLATRQKVGVRIPNPQRIQLWGSGTSGIPRRGSRTIRLFRAQPEEIFAALRAQPFGAGLQLDAETFDVVEVLDEPELHVDGQLAGAFAVGSRSVEVRVRAARFNTMFTAIEVRLAKRCHPRRFFRAAHEAIQSLPLPGRS
jgi:hypothetical protein